MTHVFVVSASKASRSSGGGTQIQLFVQSRTRRRAGRPQCGERGGAPYPRRRTVSGAPDRYSLGRLIVRRPIGVGLAYATWSGLGTAGAAVGAWLLFGERFSGLAIVGIALIIVGVGVLNLAGTSHG